MKLFSNCDKLSRFNLIKIRRSLTIYLNLVRLCLIFELEDKLLIDFEWFLVSNYTHTRLFQSVHFAIKDEFILKFYFF